MRLGTKMMLWTCCAGPTVAAMVLAGAGTASASVTARGSHTTTSHGPNGNGPGNQGSGKGQGGYGPGGNGPGNGPGGPWGGGKPACNKWELERWNVNGTNTVVAYYKTGKFNYNVSLKQDGSCLSGTLTDTGLPYGEQNMKLTGTVHGSDITFSVTYPTNYQGTRTFEGKIDRHGYVSGTWSETGTENGTGTWSLATDAKPACTRWSWARSQRGECFVRG